MKENKFLDSRSTSAHSHSSPSFSTRKRPQNWRRTVPLGYPSSPEAFKKQNSIIALIFAYYFSLWRDGSDPVTFRMLSHHCSQKVSEREEVGKYIKFVLEPFKRNLLENCFDSIHLLAHNLIGKKIFFCDFSSEYIFDVQIHIFSSTSSYLLASFPPNFAPCKTQLFFLGNLIEGQIKNLEIITDIEKYFLVFGYFCFFCKSFFKSKGTQHKCNKTATCFCCRRPIETPKTYKFSKNYFCDSGVSPNISKQCSKCNVRLFTPNCAKQHSSKVCKNGWFCESCKKYTFRSRFVKSRIEISKTHICGQEQCSFCGEIKNKNHSCPLQTCVLPQKTDITYMGFIDCQFTGQIDANCRECIDKSCSFCVDNIEKKINVCSVLHETAQRYVFDKWLFTDWAPPIEQPNVLVFEYSSCTLPKKTPPEPILIVKSRYPVNL